MKKIHTKVTDCDWLISALRAQSNFPVKSDRAQLNVHTKVPFGLPMLAFAALWCLITGLWFTSSSWFCRLPIGWDIPCCLCCSCPWLTRLMSKPSYSSCSWLSLFGWWWWWLCDWCEADGEGSSDGRCCQYATNCFRMEQRPLLLWQDWGQQERQGLLDDVMDPTSSSSSSSWWSPLPSSSWLSSLSLSSSSTLVQHGLRHDLLYDLHDALHA